MLEAKKITFEISRGKEEIRLLNDISFGIQPCHFMAIVGPSGCGKSTLLKAIAGIQPESSGDFVWDGQTLDDDHDFDPGEVGYVPQFSIAYEALTVDENIESTAKLKVKFPTSEDRDDAIDRVLEETGLMSIADRQVSILSGGQKRRLALAMELISAPRLLLCDEVTSGLDPRSEKEIVELLHNLSRRDERIIISVTHSLDHLELYDSIMVLTEGNIAFHASPRLLAHYFGVDSLDEIYPKLAQKKGVQWAQSWEKHKKIYYKKTEAEHLESLSKTNSKSNVSAKLAIPLLQETLELDPLGSESEHRKKAPLPTKNIATTKATPHDAVPGIMSQFFTLISRRFQIFFKDRSQLILQVAMVLLFPLLVALFSSKGQDPIAKLSASQDANIIQEIEQRQIVSENLVKVGSAVSGIIMFEIILLGLMGSNNSAREIAGERLIFEKEKYGGVHPLAYLGSKLGFLSVLVCIQSLWMYGFVEFFWPYRGDGLIHLEFLLLANAAMTAVCLGISSLAKTPDQASLLSIYLVGFQLPLSGAVLALPTMIEKCVQPFISAYWGWSGSLTGLDPYVNNAVKVVIDTSISSVDLCYSVLWVHIIVGIVLTYIGILRRQWN